MTIHKPALPRVMPVLASMVRTRQRRVIVSLATFAIVGSAGVASAVALSGGSGSFAVDAISAPAAAPGETVAQSVAGLWSGSQVDQWTKVAGPDWLSVTGEGVVTGTVPPSATSALVTVEADGDPGNTIQVAVPVVATGQPRRLEVASWNLDDAGSQASWSAQQKELRAIAAEGIGVVGVQESDGSAASELASDLGWHSWQSTADQGGGDLGLVSAYPISDVTPPTADVPAVSATIDVAGHDVRVWVTHLDESDYGPDRACLDGATDLAAHEASTTRATQAAAVVTAMHGDLAAASSTPVVLLGDLGSPSASDWTAATSGSHCDAGAVSWPVPGDFAAAGLHDSYRDAYPDPLAHPGLTWSPDATTADGQPEPGDRIDYVDYAGGLQLLGAESYATAAATWPSDHAASVALFALSSPSSQTSPAPSVTPPAVKPGSSTVTGTPAVGATLRATTTAWPAGTVFTYQWYAANAAIQGATAATYSPKAGQVGRALTVRVTGVRAGQRATATSKPVTVRKGTLTRVKPRVTGTAKVGRTLRAVPGRWSAGPTLHYQWYAAGRAIKGATRSTFKLKAAQRGRSVTVRVTATKSGYTSVTVASGATARVK